MLLALAVTTTTGCAVGRPAGFTARSNATCADASAAITKLSSATDPSAGLRYALDRYLIVEKAVATLTDSRLPDGQTGRELRDRWLQPARTSLGTATVELERLRQTVRRADRDVAASAFASAVVTGTVGVDAGYLLAQRLDKCAALFTPSVPPTTW
jgi:ElaB/YqjD/DUF883 family membrane-anchored ribosome-binding protein